MNHDVVENFFGCYLLYCVNPMYKGRTYIGFTVDPVRRLKQHNKGAYAGGARRTSNKGPWEMVLIVHGFPNEISALRFEWAWQHPQRSRRLRHLPAKSKKESVYEFRFQLMCHMLRVGPWNRLPLTVRWLTQDKILNFKPTLMPPCHMPITNGPVKSMKVNKPRRKPAEDSSNPATPVSQTEKDCHLCHLHMTMDKRKLQCFIPNCNAVFHAFCLSECFLKDSDDYLIPVQGDCPKCGHNVLWGDLIRYSIGCYRNLFTGEVDSHASD